MSSKKRKQEASLKARLPPSKKSKRQRTYNSSSSEESDNDGKFVARDAPRPTKKVQFEPKSILKSKTTQSSAKSSAKSVVEDSSDDDTTSEAIDDKGNDYESEVTNVDDTDSEEDDHSSSSGPDQGSENEASSGRRKTKRHDPDAFANSLNTILASKLPSTKRQDPLLARSKDAQAAGHEIAEGKLEEKARRKLREEKKLATEKGRVKNVLLGDKNDTKVVAANNGTVEDPQGMSAAEIAEQERRLRKTAQRGVVKLFNAVRAAQVKSEEAAKLVREQGVVGEKKRGEKIGEMGRNAFLEMVGAGAKTQES